MERYIKIKRALRKPAETWNTPSTIFEPEKLFIGTMDIVLDKVLLHSEKSHAILYKEWTRTRV